MSQSTTALEFAHDVMKKTVISEVPRPTVEFAGMILRCMANEPCVVFARRPEATVVFGPVPVAQSLATVTPSFLGDELEHAGLAAAASASGNPTHEEVKEEARETRYRVLSKDGTPVELCARGMRISSTNSITKAEDNDAGGGDGADARRMVCRHFEILARMLRDLRTLSGAEHRCVLVGNVSVVINISATEIKKEEEEEEKDKDAQRFETHMEYLLEYQRELTSDVFTRSDGDTISNDTAPAAVDVQ